MALLVALLLPVMLGMAGLAIDAGNLYLAHSRLQTATDAGALAGSMQLPYDPELDQGIARAAAVDMVGRNYATATVTDVSQGTGARSVCVSTSAQVDMLLMGVLGVADKHVSAKACAGFNNLEIVFVIDNSGSMKGTPMTLANQAAERLTDLVLPDGQAPAVKVGLVPFRAKIHLPGGVDGLPDGCRNADGSLDEGLRPEYTQPQYRYPSWYPLKVDEDTCTSIPRVQALTMDKQAVLDAIASQDGTGPWSGTLIGEGLKWGAQVLSPQAPYTEGEDDDRMRKILILLTDGDTEDGSCGGPYAVNYTPNNYWTNAWYNIGITNRHCQDGGPLNQDVLNEAQAAKDAGVEIFAIRYGTSDSTDIALMKTVASSKDGTDDHYFDAPSAYDFDEIFKKIGSQLGWRLLN